MKEVTIELKFRVTNAIERELVKIVASWPKLPDDVRPRFYGDDDLRDALHEIVGAQIWGETDGQEIEAMQAAFDSIITNKSVKQPLNNSRTDKRTDKRGGIAGRPDERQARG